jgi:hypothetical protein
MAKCLVQTVIENDRVLFFLAFLFLGGHCSNYLVTWWGHSLVAIGLVVSISLSSHREIKKVKPNKKLGGMDISSPYFPFA